MSKFSTFTNVDYPLTPKVPEHWRALPCRAFVAEKVEKNNDGIEREYLSLMSNVGVIRYSEKGDVGNKAPDDLTKCKVVEKGNLVINSMNYSIGSYGISPYDGVCSPVYIVLEPITSVVLRRFALRIFENKEFQNWAQSFGSGILAHRAAIGWDDLKNIIVGIPPLGEQQKIARFLDYETAKIDALIDEQKRLIDLLKEKRQAVISHAVTKGLNPDAPMKDSGVEWLGEVPEHWVVSKVKYEFVNLDSKRRPLSAEERGGMQGEFDYYGASGVIDQVNNFLFDEPLVIVSEDGANLLMRNKKISFVATGKYWVNNHAHILRPTRDNLVTYWSHLIELSDITNFVTGSAQPKLTSEALGELPIAFPESEKERFEIYRFIEFQLKGIDSLLEESSLTNKLLKERRSALISAAVTGKIDVRNWQPPAGSDTVDSNASVQTERHYG